MKVSGLVFLAVASTLSHGSAKVSPNQTLSFKSYTSTTSLRTQAPVWSDGRLSLFPNKAPASSVKGWVLLRTQANSSTQKKLPGSALLAPISSTLDAYLAVFPIDNLALLDEWATPAHEEMNRCGSLEFIPLNYRLSSTQEFHQALYSPWVKFDAIPPILDTVELSSIDQSLNTVTALPSRFHRHAEGQNAGSAIASLWRNQLQSQGRWTIEEKTHSDTPQKSVIARLAGSDTSAETIIIGAHLDSIANHRGGTASGLSPGEDDDAAGIAILTEILRVIEAKGLRFSRTIELHGYAAEEVGLVGSRDLASQYRAQGQKIAGMMQLDMAYYSEGDSDGFLYLIGNFTSIDLNRSAVEWILSYIGPYIRRGRIPEGTSSDHKAWWEQGYQTLFPFEDPEHYNPNIHTPYDTRKAFDSGLRMKRMVQLGLLFAIHEGGWTDLEASYKDKLSSSLPQNLSNELYLAIQKAEGDLHYLAVAAPNSAAMLEFCRIDEAIALHCSSERNGLLLNQEAGSQRVFYQSEGFALHPGERWRILAYDASDKLIAWRQVEIEK